MVCGELRIVPVEKYGKEKKVGSIQEKMNGKEVEEKKRT